MSEIKNNIPDIIYKFILIGDTFVGKSCIFKKISYDRFDFSNFATTGIDYKSLDYEIEIEENNQKIIKNAKIQLFDTAGQERFKAFTKNYIYKSNGIIIVYDITDRKSFDDVAEWIKSIEEIYGKCEKTKTCILLIGNKNDLVEGEEGEKRRVVQIDEAEKLAEKYKIIWDGECSALTFTKKQFDEIFIKLAKTIYSKFGYEEQKEDNISLDSSNISERNENENCKC